MIPSKILRKIISQMRKLNLEAYSWNKEFEKNIFDIKINDSGKKYTLQEVYEAGCNIGNCLLTSNHIHTVINNSSICAGKVEILKGTKNSPSGDHVWVEDYNTIIDPTLMIIIPKTDILAQYYHKDYTLSISQSNIDLTYNDEFCFRNKQPDFYYRSIYRIKE